MGETEAAIRALADEIRTLLIEVREERRALHRERHAIFNIVLEGGHLPTMCRLADVLNEQADRLEGKTN